MKNFWTQYLFKNHRTPKPSNNSKNKKLKINLKKKLK